MQLKDILTPSQWTRPSMIWLLFIFVGLANTASLSLIPAPTILISCFLMPFCSFPFVSFLHMKYLLTKALNSLITLEILNTFYLLLILSIELYFPLLQASSSWFVLLLRKFVFSLFCLSVFMYNFFYYIIISVSEVAFP